METIDKGNPSGKRDYAIVLLASMLGMRAVDIRKMTFHNIDWDRHRIDIIQSKSKRAVTYPLLSSIGWAIIDYIKHGRPKCGCQEIFVTHTPPYRPFAAAASLDGMLLRYLKLAHIHVPHDKKIWNAFTPPHLCNIINGETLSCRRHRPAYGTCKFKNHGNLSEK